MVLVLFGAAGCSSQVLEPIVKGGGSNWCATHGTTKTVYCRDFDDGRNFDTGWSAIYSKPSDVSFANVDCGSYAPDSGPCSLLVVTPQVLVNDDAEFQLQQLIESNSGVSLEFALKIVNYDIASPNVGLIALYLQTTKEWWLSLDIVAGELQLTECQSSLGDCPGQHKGGPPIFDTWHSVRLQVLATASPPNASVAYDSHVIMDAVPISPPATPTQLLTQWGANYVKGPANPMRLSYDNIKIDTL